MPTTFIRNRFGTRIVPVPSRWGGGRIGLAVAAATLAAGLAALAGDRGGRDGLVHELMERTHEGRRSPYGQLRAILAGPGAPWPVVEQTVRGFEPMCRALLASPNAAVKDSADGYVDAVKEMVTAVKRRDSKALRAGYAALEAACGDCHYKGGIGGQLERDHEREEDRARRDDD